MNSLSDQVYKLLYDKSCLSDGDIGVRVCHEDEWPIDEIVDLIIEYYNIGYKASEVEYAKR